MQRKQNKLIRLPVVVMALLLTLTGIAIAPDSVAGLAPPLFAQEKIQKKTILQWSAVRGADRYRVQVRNSKNRIVFQTITTGTSLEVDLPSGKYQQRVGALNKFQKVSAWSGWKDIKIIETAKPGINELKPHLDQDKKEFTIEVVAQNVLPETTISLKRDGQEVPIKEVKRMGGGKLEIVLDMDNVGSGDYNLELENPGGLKASSDSEKTRELDDDFFRSTEWGKLAEARKAEAKAKEEATDESAPGASRALEKWELLIPGYYQARTDRYLQAGGWAMWFASTAGGGYAGWSHANQAASSLESSFLFQMFSSKTKYDLYYPLIPASVDTQTLYVLHNNNVKDAQAQYSAGQTGQAVAGGVALASYFGYITYETWPNLDWKTPVPGWKRLEKGDSITGYSLITVTALSAIAAGASHAAANNQSATAKSTLFYRLYNDPAFYFMATSTLPSSDILQFSLLDMGTYNRAGASYDKANTAYAASSGVLVAALLYNYIDSALFLPETLPGMEAKKDQAAMQTNRHPETSVSWSPSVWVQPDGEIKTGARLQFRF